MDKLIEVRTGKAISVYAIACLIWGSTWLVIRIGLESLTPFISAGFRFVTASLIVFGITRFRKIKIQTDPAAKKIYMQMAFFSFAIPFGLIYWAEQFIPSGLAAVLFAIYPFVIALISYFVFPGERIGVYKVAGMIISFSGLFFIFSDEFNGPVSNYFWGMSAVIAGSVMQAFVAVAVKKNGHHLNPLSMNFVPMLISGVTFLIAGYFIEDMNYITFDGRAYFSILYLALFGSVITFTSYYWLLKRLNIVLLSLIAFITPVLAVILGAVFFGEVFSAHHIMGSVMVLAGLLFAIFGNLKKVKLKEI